ncbi:MAG: 50S ribosomal protein L29 [Candidatus Levybacteria bacterium]|nr:50S ribosomal protein L29 [Candidatus Levybacteria bacterium]
MKQKQEIHGKKEKELYTMLSEIRDELFKARIDFTQGKLKNPSLLRHKRKEIAIILTILSEKEKKHENT